MNSNAINIDFSGPTMSVPVEAVKDLTAYGEWILLAIFEQEMDVEDFVRACTPYNIWPKVGVGASLPGRLDYRMSPPQPLIRCQFAIVGKPKESALLTMHLRCSEAESRASHLDKSIERLYDEVAKSRSTAIEQETPDTAAKCYDAVLGMIEPLRKKKP